jgi:hypothetical protein
MLGLTRYGAEWLGADKYIGSLEVGKFADFVVLEKDYFRVPAEKIGENSITATFVGGKAVYMRKKWQKYLTIQGHFAKRSLHDDGSVDLEEEDHAQLVMLPGVQEMHDQFAHVDASTHLGRAFKQKRDLSGHLTCGCTGH